MTNKKLGNDFERQFAELLSQSGFWVHLLAQNQDGQPADIIAVKRKKAYLIDCKVCSTDKGFDLSRVEENQESAMTLWNDCENGNGYFALLLGEKIYMVDFPTIRVYRRIQSIMPVKYIEECATPVEVWLKWIR